MSENKDIEGWGAFLAAAVVKPIWQLATTGFIVTVLFVSTWWRDNFASLKWRERLELKGFLPHWHPAWWICIGLLVSLFLILKASHDLWLVQRTLYLNAIAKRPLPSTAPEFTLTSDRTRDMGLPVNLLLTNISKEHVHDLRMDPSQLENGITVIWIPAGTPLLEGRAQMYIKPWIIIQRGETNSDSTEGLGDLVKILAAKLPDRPMTPLPPVVFTCRDRSNNLYRITVPLLYTKEPGPARISIAAPQRELLIG